ncbi:winged helix-turn-helix transcriptional regulator [Paenibacillus sp. SI8]
MNAEYELTERGRRLQPFFAAMSAWVQSEHACQKKELEAIHEMR